MNDWGVKTHTGKSWGKTGNSVYSVLKRFRERDDRIKKTEKKYEPHITDFEIRYLKN